MHTIPRHLQSAIVATMVVASATVCSAQSHVAVGVTAGTFTDVGVDTRLSSSPTTTVGGLVFLDAFAGPRISIGAEVGWAAPRSIRGRLEHLPSTTDVTIRARETYVSVPVKVNVIAERRFDLQAVVAGGVALGRAMIDGSRADIRLPSSFATFVDRVSTRAPVVTVGIEAGLMISRRSAFVFSWRLQATGDRYGVDDEFRAALGGSAARFCGGARYLF
jgi:hypothetical protein